MTQAFTPKQFRMAFRTEKQCREYLLRLKHPDGFRCRKCHHTVCHDIAHRSAWQCAGCGYQESAKAGTVFHKSKVTLVNWFRAIFELTVSKGGISAVELQSRLGLGSYKTAWGMLHKLREAMAKREATSRKLAGTVELDGALIGRRAQGNQAAVYVAIEVTENKAGKPCAGRLRAARVDKFRREDAFWFIEENIADGTTVRTDATNEIRSVAEHLDIELVQKGTYREKERLSSWLPWMHRILSNFKAAMHGVYHGVSAKYLEAYLAEYAYRFNRCGKRQELQSRLLHACAACGPVTLADIAA
jgi:ribosomal protein L37AE/L43A